MRLGAVTFRFIQGLGGGALLVTAQTFYYWELPNSKEDGNETIWNGCDCGPTSPPLEAILWIFSWPLFFYQYSFRDQYLLTPLSFVRSPKWHEEVWSIDWLGIILLASSSAPWDNTRAWTTGWLVLTKLIFVKCCFTLGNTIHLASVDL
jgi:hypothetical protein